MKKQINPTIKAHLIRGAFYLLLLLAVCAIPFALAQRNATRRTGINPAAKTDASANKYMAQVSQRTDGAVSQQPLPKIPAMDASQLPKASTGPVGVPSFRVLPVPKLPAVTLYDQYNNAGTTATSSQDFETAFDAFDSFTADDFVVPAGQTWNITEVDVQGLYFNCTTCGPAASFNVFFYQDSSTLPGTLVATRLANTFTGTTDFVITLTSAVTLTPGTYWVSVQARLDFGTGGQFGWQDRTVQSNSGAAFENPGGGFACPGGNGWVRKPTCVTTTSPDQVFRLVGTIGGGTPTPTPTGTPASCNTYITIPGTGTITPGTTDTGNHCDDCATAVALPFPVSVYGQTFNSVNVASNGSLDLIGTQAPFTHGCQVLPNTLWTMAILPYQDDLRTDNLSFTGCNVFPGATCGIFTSTTGTAPNRHFNVEWRAVHFADTTTSVNFEVVFSENQSSFDVIYGATSDSGLDETSGVQASETGPATTFSCGTATLTNGLKVTYMCSGGPSPTPTPTGTPSCTPAWQNEPPMANARRNPATAVVGSNLYAITGFNLAPDYTAVNERFNGASWTTLAPIPVPHAQSRGTAVGTNIYVPGGFNSVSFGGPLDTMQIYNTTANTWSAGMVLPAARSGVATAAFNGLVYVIGGYNPTGTGHTEVYIYNPGTNSYTTGAPMPAGQGNAAGVLFNGEIYVVGGGTAPGAQYAYNPTTNMWRTIAALPTTGGTCQSDNGFVLNNELWVVGCLGLAINQQVWIYNSGTDSWRAGPPYNVDHQGPGAALFNGRGFVVGGGTATGGSNAVESIGPCGPTPTPTATPTASPSATATSTPTPTAPATATPTAPATATPTASPSCTPVAGQITTLFGSNNGGSAGGAVLLRPHRWPKCNFRNCIGYQYRVDGPVHCFSGLCVTWDDLGRERNQYGPLDASGDRQRNRGRSRFADSRDFIEPDSSKRGHPLRNRSGSRPRNYAQLHQRQWIESKLFQCGPVPCPRIRLQRAVYRAGVLAPRLEWDRLLQFRFMWQSNSNTYRVAYVHAEFVQRADRLC